MFLEAAWLDLKTFVAIVAGIISIISCIITIVIYRSNDARWNQINLGEINLHTLKALTWKEYEIDEAKNIDWGYDAILVPDETYFKKINLKSVLCASAPNSPFFTGFEKCLTLSEATTEAKRVNLPGGPDYPLVAVFKIKYGLKNIGNTALFNLSTSMSFSTSPNPNPHLKQQDLPKNESLLPGNQMVIEPVILVENTHQIPEFFYFEFKADYDDINGKKKSKIFKRKYTVRDDHWAVC